MTKFAISTSSKSFLHSNESKRCDTYMKFGGSVGHFWVSHLVHMPRSYCPSNLKDNGLFQLPSWPLYSFLCQCKCYISSIVLPNPATHRILFVHGKSRRIIVEGHHDSQSTQTPKQQQEKYNSRQQIPIRFCVPLMLWSVSWSYHVFLSRRDKLKIDSPDPWGPTPHICNLFWLLCSTKSKNICIQWTRYAI